MARHRMEDEWASKRKVSAKLTALGDRAPFSDFFFTGRDRLEELTVAVMP
jgi:hypothetical protein